MWCDDTSGDVFFIPACFGTGNAQVPATHPQTQTPCQKFTLKISYDICKMYSVIRGNNAPKRFCFFFYSQLKWYFKGCLEPEVGVSMATVCCTTAQAAVATILFRIVSWALLRFYCGLMIMQHVEKWSGQGFTFSHHVSWNPSDGQLLQDDAIMIRPASVFHLGETVW